MKCHRIHTVSASQLRRLAALKRRRVRRTRWRCADCGGFVTRDYADSHPHTTLSERVK